LIEEYDHRGFAQYDDDVVAVGLKFCMDWRQEIHMTSFGMEIGHLCKVLEICMDAQTSAYTIVENGILNGCFLRGEKFMVTKGDGATFEGVSDTAAEKRALSLHSTTLDEIRNVIGMPASWETPTTMRRLRTIVFSGGEPAGMVKNRVAELLPDLTFNEAHDPINATTVTSTIDYLTSEKFIPDTMYLDRRSFFATRRDVLILARFGPRAPSFKTGVNMTRFTAEARGEGITMAKPYQSMAPTPLFVVRKPTLAAANDWVGLIKTGAAGIGTVEVEGGFTFRGSDRVTVWGSLNACLGSHIRQQRVEAGDAGGNKRVVEEGEIAEDLGNVEVGSKQKKRRVI
jgi:hypothetical protein